MIWHKTRTRLIAGEPVLGWFHLSGSDNVVPGLLRWSSDSGAMIELVDSTDWGVPLNTEHLTVHGVLEESDAITLLEAIVRTTTMEDEVKRIGAYTLVLGEHIESDTTWERAIYASANLAEWRGATGLTHSLPGGPEQPFHYRIDWEPPEVQEFSARGARMRFVTEVDREIGLMPKFSLGSRQRLVVEPGRPMRIAELSRRYAMPLLAFTAFAADRPDSILEELYLHGKRQQRVEVWRAGSIMESAEWRHNALLFHADDLTDFRLSLVRWWRLYEKVRPALGIFGDHLNEGSSYSRPRLITLHTAICGYSDARHGHRSLRKLRAYADVPNEVTGCSNNALALFGAARDYFAHLGNPGQRFSTSEIEGGAFLATRRASALMQACLLRELGFSKTRTTELLQRHYSNWRL